MNASILVIFGVLLLTFVLGVMAKRGKDMNLEQWTVGGRGFGSLVVFILLAGEIYTTSTFLGSSGWAYGKGGPAMYIFAYASLGYLMSFWLLPAIWKYAKKHKLISQSDFFASKYKSPYLGVLVSLVGVVALIPYLVIQLKGLGIIVSTASYGSISPTLAIWIGVIAITVYVMISGVHGSAATSILKDGMVLLVCLFIGIYIPFHYYGGVQPIFETINKANPGFLTLPKTGLSISWFLSTVFLTALGFYMWPHSFSATYTAKGAKVFKKNAIIIPLYALIQLFIFFVGFTALLQVPGLKDSQIDLALLEVSMKTFDPWFVGIIGAAGLLTALVPGSLILMNTSTLIAKNIYHVFSPNATEQRVMNVARSLVPIVALIAVYFTLGGGGSIITISLLGYSFVTQLAPSLFCSLLKRNFVTKQGAMTGIIVGVVIVSYVTVTQTTMAVLFPSLPSAIQDLNIGLVALFFNIISMIVVSFFTRKMAITNQESTKCAG